MMRLVRTGRLAVWLAGASVCANVGPGCASDLPRPSPVPIGRPFELHPMGSALADDALTVTFEGVRSDSRCPTDVVCISAGDATVVVRLTAPTGGQVERELHTNPGRTGTAETSYLAYAITLVALSPMPRSDRPIPLGDYVATLTIERR
jgi:hypothetical protein